MYFASGERDLIVDYAGVDFFSVVFLRRIGSLVCQFTVVLNGLVCSFVARSSASEPSGGGRARLQDLRGLHERL